MWDTIIDNSAASQFKLFVSLQSAGRIITIFARGEVLSKENKKVRVSTMSADEQKGWMILVTAILVIVLVCFVANAATHSSKSAGVQETAPHAAADNK